MQDDTNASSTDDFYLAKITSANDYYPGGMPMYARTFQAYLSPIDYRFGFNSFEEDDELKGSENHISFADYGYDSRLARRLNTDPITFPDQGPYCTFNNNPILFTDPTGKGAEVSAERDKNGKVTSINVKAKFYVHGKDADKAVELFKADIEKNIKNKPELKGAWGSGRKVTVNFDISIEAVDDDQLEQRKKEHETDKSINIVEMNDDQSNYLGEGNFALSLVNQENRGNTFSHEFFHMMGFNSGEWDPTHFSNKTSDDKYPLMYSNQGGSEILKQRILTSDDIKGLRNKQGLNFSVSGKKKLATKVVEYPDPLGNNPYINGEKYKKK